jgi:aminoglycoside phosphotransferase (APT) family kinase protein
MLPSAENVEVHGLARISDGWETDVYSFAVEYGKANSRQREELILRIYPGDDASQKSAREFNAMKQLHSVGYPVPQVLLLEQEDASPNDVSFGKPFVIMERIAGRPMGTVIDESPLERKLELLTLFCQMFVDLHALDWRPFAPDATSGEVPDPAALLGRAVAQGQATLHHFQRHEFDPVFDWLRERLPGVGFGPPSVTHGDYHPWNVLLREDGAAFVIDWTNVVVADYRADLAWTLLLMSTYGSAEPRQIVLRDYARIAGREVERIELFDVIACLRRLATILIALRSGAGQMGMRPGAEAMMKDTAHIGSVYALLRERTGIAIAEVERLLSTLQ